MISLLHKTTEECFVCLKKTHVAQGKNPKVPLCMECAYKRLPDAPAKDAGSLEESEREKKDGKAIH